MTHRMAILDHTGHTMVEWDTDLDTSVEAAEKAFNSEIRQGKAVFVETEGDKLEQTVHFIKTKDMFILSQQAGG